MFSVKFSSDNLPPVSNVLFPPLTLLVPSEKISDESLERELTHSLTYSGHTTDLAGAEVGILDFAGLVLSVVRNSSPRTLSAMPSPPPPASSSSSSSEWWGRRPRPDWSLSRSSQDVLRGM